MGDMRKRWDSDLLDVLYEGVYSVDRHRRILAWNRGAETITGYPAGTALGTRCQDNLLVHISDRGGCLCEEGCPLEATMADGRDREAEAYLLHRDGHRVPVAVRTKAIVGAGGAIVGGSQVFKDRSPEIAALEKATRLERLSQTDPLTGVANRRLLHMTLANRLGEFRRFGWGVGVIFVDIDHFKRINDRLGHDVGDRALQLVARSLCRNVRSFDLVSRWGGEEFVCVLANVGAAELATSGERFRALIEHSRLTIGSEVILVTVSAGATLARPGDTARALIKRADQLMYDSKAAGRNRLTVDG